MGRVLIRVHENRAMFDFNGWMQWKPVGGKTWYVMHRWAIDPIPMATRISAIVDQEMLPYEVAYEVEGEWQKEKKRMFVTSLIGPVG